MLDAGQKSSEESAVRHPHTMSGERQRSTRNLKSTALIVSVGFILFSIFAFQQAPRDNPFASPSLVESIFFPQEKNAFMRLPAINTAINGIHASADGRLVWAVGDGGLIVHSRDGGVTWQQQYFDGGPKRPSGAAAPAVSMWEGVSLFSDANAAVGDYDSKLESADAEQVIDEGGYSYQSPSTNSPQQQIQQRPIQQQIDNDYSSRARYQEDLEQAIIEKDQRVTPASNKTPSATLNEITDLYALVFLDDMQGIAVGEKGTLLRTVDAGKVWLRVDVPTRGDILALDFLDRERGVAVGENGVILLTMDGGATWAISETKYSTRFNAVDYVSEKSLFIVGGRDQVLFSDDGSTSWSSIDIPELSYPSGISFIDSSTGFIVGSDGGIYKTLDGGRRWIKLITDSDADFNAVDFLDAQRGIVVGDGGMGLQTNDGGQTWRPFEHNNIIEFQTVYFSSSTTAYIAGSGGTVFNLDAKASAWRQLTRGWQLLYGFQQFDELGLAMSVGGNTLFRTKDKGRSWELRELRSEYALSQAYFVSATLGFAVGERGQIVKTTNGGDSWAQKDSKVDRELYDVHFPSTQIGYAAGEDGTFLKSIDGGETWRNLSLASGTGDIFFLYFIDNEIGFLSDDAGSIRKTSDGGASWRAVYQGEEIDIYSFQFLNRNVGFVASSGGQVLKTTDAGDSWQSIAQLATLDLPDLFFLSDSLGFVVGRTDTLYRIKEGGNIWEASTPSEGSWLVDVHFFNASEGLLLTADGSILVSSDGGEQWHSLRYQRYPSVFYFFVCLMCIPLLFKLVTDKPVVGEAPTETVADMLATDKPLEPGDPDPLAFGAIARGLSRFMRNPKTTPPLTLAISGAWGTGKSSLMNLLYHELKDYGYTPVWFNAWHHQKGEQLLASLYANIREQAIPGWFKFSGTEPVGLNFRFNLLFRRSLKNALLTLVLVFIFIAALVHLYHNTPQLGALNSEQLTASLVQLLKGNIEEFFVIFLGGLAPIATLLRTMRAFGLSPSSLITSHRNGHQEKTRLDPSARQRFAREFSDVTNSLGLGRMVIFIDDLDRCNKENVVDILEAINFLSVSGDCFIVLGMDEKWIKHCVSEHFPKMAQDNPNFADNYLEKMINIRVPVPTMGASDSRNLLIPEASLADAENDSGILTPFKRWFITYRYASLILLMSILAFFFVNNLSALYQVPDKPIGGAVENLKTVMAWDDVVLEQANNRDDVPNVSVNIDEGDSSEAIDESVAHTQWQVVLNASDDAIDKGIVLAKLGEESAYAELVLKAVRTLEQENAAIATERPAQPTRNSGLNDGDPELIAKVLDKKTAPKTVLLVTSATVVMLFALCLVVYFSRKVQRVVHDSSSFKQALEFWHPWIVLDKSTPRTLKRYLNHVRYLAMRYRDSEGESSADGELENVNEETLVALSAIYSLDSRWFTEENFVKFRDRDHMKMMLISKFPMLNAKNDQDVERVISQLQQAFTLHEQRFPLSDSFSRTNRERFLHIMAQTDVA